MKKNNKYYTSLIKKEKNKTQILFLSLIMIGSLTFSINIFPIGLKSNEDIGNKFNNDNIDQVPRSSAFPNFFINESDPTLYNWADYPVINGSGEEFDPYIIRDLIIDNTLMDQGGIFIYNSKSYVEIINCTFINCVGFEAQLQTYNDYNFALKLYNTTNINIINSTISGIMAFGMSIEESKSILIENCNFTSTYQQLSIRYSNNVSLINNNFIDIIYGGNIFIEYSHDLIFQNNHFDDTGLMYEFSYNLNFGDTNFFNDLPIIYFENEVGVDINNSQYNFDIGMLLLNNCSYFNINGLIFNNGYCGIYIYNSSDGFIQKCEGNNILNFGMVSYYSNNISIINNTFSQSKNGIFSQFSENVIITQNFISNLTYHGIFGDNNCLVNNNTILNSGECGIVFLGTSNIIEGNNLNNNEYGIILGDYISISATNNQVIGNIISNSHDSGLVILNGTSNIFDDNLLLNNTRGIVTQNPDAKFNMFSNNSIKFSTDGGIYLNGGVNNTFEKNLIYNCSLGIVLDNDDYLCENNTFIQNYIVNHTIGILVEGNNHNFIDNLIFESNLLNDTNREQFIVMSGDYFGHDNQTFDAGINTQWTNTIINILDDFDEDTILSIDEILLYSTDPMLKDSDGDGYSDNREVNIGTNPILFTFAQDIPIGDTNLGLWYEINTNNFLIRCIDENQFIWMMGIIDTNDIGLLKLTINSTNPSNYPLSSDVEAIQYYIVKSDTTLNSINSFSLDFYFKDMSIEEDELLCVFKLENDLWIEVPSQILDLNNNKIKIDTAELDTVYVVGIKKTSIDTTTTTDPPSIPGFASLYFLFSITVIMIAWKKNKSIYK